MHAFSKRFGTGKFVKWEIKKGRSANEIHSIALGMMMMTARLFEGYQASPFFSWYTDSGFSGEDLTSDLPGFYRAILPTNYQSILGLVSKKEALKRWDYYGPIGSYKNTGLLDAQSLKAWYLLAAQGEDTIEVAYLDGLDTQYLEQQQGFTVDGVTFKVCSHFNKKGASHAE